MKRVQSPTGPMPRAQAAQARERAPLAPSHQRGVSAAATQGAVQLRLQAMADRHALQRHGAKGVVQAKSEVINFAQVMNWGDALEHSTRVGRSMVAYLDPADPISGESASVNADQTPMMHWIKQHAGIGATHAVKGHLLNDNLGGKALNANLFPISKAANAVHLRTAENLVKNKVWDEQQGVRYAVDAVQSHGGFDGQFRYSVQNWNPEDKQTTGDVESGTIDSDMGSPVDMGVANPDDLEYVTAEMRNADAVRRGVARPTASGSGELSERWSSLRADTARVWALGYGSSDGSVIGHKAD